ncbi:MAG TPA: hypothetical protein DEB39_16070 [Planctomycetaceae bacterium]|nr:hypothetical protein [Planctomycetaceae bacterium]
MSTSLSKLLPKPLSVIHCHFLCEYGSLNGGEQSLLAVLPLLREQGVRPNVLAPTEGNFIAALRNAGIETTPLPFAQTDSLEHKRRRLAGLLGSLRGSGRLDLLHANSLSMGRLSGPVVAAMRTPSIAHLRDIIKLPNAAVDDLNRHSLLLAVSDATRRFHLAQGIDAERCRTLYNGIDLERFKPGEATGYLHRELGLPDHPEDRAPLLATIGQIGLRKGQDTLFDALDILFGEYGKHGKYHDWFRCPPHLLLVGRRWSEKAESREFEQRLRARAEHPPLKGHVHFLGVRDDIPALLREVTLLIHPARQEPLGRVLLEAAASACPVIASAVGGTTEIFPTDLEAAATFPPNNSVFLAKVICELLDSPVQRRKMGTSAREYAARTFDAHAATESLIRLYRGVCSEAGPVCRPAAR